MKKLIIAFFALATALAPTLVMAAGPGVHLDKAGNDLTDKESLQRGFTTYNDYCLSCHTLKYQRYNRTFLDIGLTEEEGMANYMRTGEKVGDHITNSMPENEAAVWFGSAPPDLTLVTRFRSPDWVYTYLRSFYVDGNRPFGVNNVVFKDVGMPHVLQGLQGIRTMDEDGHLSDAAGGSLSAEEYDAKVRDLVNFLEYVGEPIQLERKRLGGWVIAFLFVLLILSYLLKKEYWRDVH